MPVTKAKQGRKTKVRKKKFVAELHLTYTYHYDPESKEFKDAFESYKKNINPNGDEQDMLCHIAHNVYLNGRPDMVDGVGYVTFHGFKVPDAVKEQFTGIDLVHGIPLPDIDIISNDYI